MGDITSPEAEPHVLRTHIAALGKEIIFSEAERNAPVIFGRKPETKDPKYAVTKRSDEIHVKLVDEAGQEIRRISRRSLAVTYSPKGYQIENLTNGNLSYEIDPGSKKALSPKFSIMVPVWEMRNFKVEIAPGFMLRTQAISGGTGRPDRVKTLLFKRGKI